MRLVIFTVYDSCAELFGQPFFTNTVGAAERIIGEAVNEAGHSFNKHPGDYTLFELGTYESDTGAIITLPAAINRGLLITYKKEQTATPIQRGMSVVPGMEYEEELIAAGGNVVTTAKQKEN